MLTSKKKMRKSAKKCEKIPKSTKKLVDLVCTKGFLLYKSEQKRTSAAKTFLGTFGLLFITIWKSIKCDQMRPNAAKRKHQQNVGTDRRNYNLI